MKQKKQTLAQFKRKCYEQFLAYPSYISSFLHFFFQWAMLLNTAIINNQYIPKLIINFIEMNW